MLVFFFDWGTTCLSIKRNRKTPGFHDSMMVPSPFSHLPAEAATKTTFVRRYEIKSGFNCG